jgi:ATP-binding cassette subfamily F protein 3
LIAVNLDKVSITYIEEPIFEDLNWEIHNHRVSGLIGPNGSGKSTLLKLIHGDLKSDTGFVTYQTNTTIGFLPQEPDLNPQNTVWQEMIAANKTLAQIEIELDYIERNLSQPEVYNNEKMLAETLDQQARLLRKFTEAGGNGYEGQIRSTLDQLGFSETEFHLATGSLSGGQKKLVSLAKLLIMHPSVLLLDEPDNHLDLSGKDYLANLIRNYSGAVVIVSHDRFLLDLVADEIVELEEGKLTRYPGNYSEYAFEKHNLLLRQQQMFQAQQKEIKRLEQSANRLLSWGKIYDNKKFIRRGKNILKRIDKIDKIDQPIIEPRKMKLELKGWRGSKKVLEIKNLEKVFPSTDQQENSSIFRGLNATIWRGWRVGIIGPNGAGKSLLFRIILGQEVPTTGNIIIGPSVEIGYYAQEHENLKYDQTLIDTLRYANPMSESQAVAFLGKFLFSYEQAQGLISSLSGGERSRLQMALLMLSGGNFLLLDEPTNNLDIQSTEILEDTLADFDGTILAISHDRYFLDRIADHIWELNDGNLNEYIGNFNDFQEWKEKQTQV